MGMGTDRLDRYWAQELGCAPEALNCGGLTICAPPHRERPRWMGWLVPMECIVSARAMPDTGVISVTPALAASLRRFISPGSHARSYLPPEGKGLHQFAHTHLPAALPKVHAILICEESSFQSAPEVLPVSRLSEDDLQIGWFRSHFDGPIYAARNERGSIVSWAAIKCKSDEVWEMAVATESPYRGRGLARSVVSRATEATLHAGKLPLYLHEISNHSSARVCRALGYTPYGYELTCEQGRVMTRA